MSVRYPVRDGFRFPGVPLGRPDDSLFEPCPAAPPRQKPLSFDRSDGLSGMAAILSPKQPSCPLVVDFLIEKSEHSCDEGRRFRPIEARSVVVSLTRKMP